MHKALSCLRNLTKPAIICNCCPSLKILEAIRQFLNMYTYKVLRRDEKSGSYINEMKPTRLSREMAERGHHSVCW